MATYEELVKANEQIKTTDIKGKEYAEVNQRIKAFRMVYPEGTINTELISNNAGICIFQARVYAGLYAVDNLLAVGHAYEKEGSSFINKTSYIENCETSAVGRALGMAGFGIDTSVASYEEVETAIANQPIEKKDIKIITQMAEKYNKDIFDICKAYSVDELKDMTKAQYADCIKQFQKLENK